MLHIFLFNIKNLVELFIYSYEVSKFPVGLILHHQKFAFSINSQIIFNFFVDPNNVASWGKK